jgi:hypothetical protein
MDKITLDGAVTSFPCAGGKSQFPNQGSFSEEADGSQIYQVDVRRGQSPAQMDLPMGERPAVAAQSSVQREPHDHRRQCDGQIRAEE